MNKRFFRLAIASGKGGTGKTFVSTNLFCVLNDAGYNVTLVDCDAESPNDLIFFESTLTETKEVIRKVPVINETLCSFCGKCHEYCSFNAIFMLPQLKHIYVLDDLCHSCGACFIACEKGAITEKTVCVGSVNRHIVENGAAIIEARMKVGVSSPVPVISNAIRQIQEPDIAILDAPPGTSCPFIQTIADADYIVLVTEPTPYGLSDLKQSVETIRLLKKPFGVIINRVGIGNNEVHNYLIKDNIELLFEIPFSKNFAFLYAEGKLIVRDKPEWKKHFVNMFKKIVEAYGNSCD